MHPRNSLPLRPALLAALLSGILVPLAAQELPVTKVALFSSGVGYFEQRGSVTGDAKVSIPFSIAGIDDALKSLVVRDYAGAKDLTPAGAAAPSLSYPSLEPVDDALRNLRIDLSGSPKLADILRKQRGAELAVQAPEAIVGRIVSVEDRPTGFQGQPRATLVLLTDKGLRAIALDDIASFRFTDPSLMADFDQALALILGSRNADMRSIDLRLPGSGSREVAIGYVVAAPVWKASYRLDLSGKKPWIQAWAIVDNPSAMDWKDVSLSLVSGRPVSFVQRLYAPLMLDRPVLPLSIAGTAEARVYDSGMGGLEAEKKVAAESTYGDFAAPSASAPPPSARSMSVPQAAPAPSPASAFDLAGSGTSGLAVAQAAGDQFEFTIPTPVSLGRGRSAMLPLVAGAVAAEKVSIFTADSGESNPMLGVRLTNSLGMKLPAGPVTVFDGGIYAGDALIEFLPEKDKRLIVYGQDLSVTATDSRSSARETIGVKVSKGALVFSRRLTWTRSYEFKNASATPRKLVVEHPIMAGAELLAPKDFEEKTESLYRFALALPASGEARLDVVERLPQSERMVIAGLGTAAYLSFASSTELPPNIKSAMKKAADLASRLDDARRALADLSSRRDGIVGDQARIRQNLSAVGKDSPQGKEYLKRLMDSESSLDDLATKTTAARGVLADAQNALDGYVAGLDLGS
ncbi:MAG TPA: DUF4139 domain-containing protein [Rectinemataceae bacterium]|nr:DUF4139 domain-containing protein [Rectinemataceae bacterium]